VGVIVQIIVNKKTENDKKKKEFTKTAYKFNVAFVVFITLLSFALMVYSAFTDHIDITAIAYIVPPAWIEVGAFSGFYIWKAKHENLSKALYGDFTKEKQEIETTEDCNNYGEISK